VRREAEGHAALPLSSRELPGEAALEPVQADGLEELAESAGTRLKDWKTKPSSSLRSLESSRSRRPEISLAPSPRGTSCSLL
jgi:hypothetical protein